MKDFDSFPVKVSAEFNIANAEILHRPHKGKYLRFLQFRFILLQNMFVWRGMTVGKLGSQQSNRKILTAGSLAASPVTEVRVPVRKYIAESKLYLNSRFIYITAGELESSSWY